MGRGVARKRRKSALCLFLSQYLLQAAYVFSLLPVLPAPSRQMGQLRGLCAVEEKKSIFNAAFPPRRWNR